jgi:lipid A disaccharide synthetase
MYIYIFTRYYILNRKNKLQIFALPNIFFKRLTTYIHPLKITTNCTFPSIRQRSQHFTFDFKEQAQQYTLRINRQKLQPLKII